MRKTPPGRAVIVGKGVGVTAQLDPARPPQGRQWWRTGAGAARRRTPLARDRRGFDAGRHRAWIEMSDGSGYLRFGRGGSLSCRPGPLVGDVAGHSVTGLGVAAGFVLALVAVMLKPSRGGLILIGGVLPTPKAQLRNGFRSGSSARCQRLAASSATRLTPYFLATRERVSPRLTT